jgi:chromosomal replication initiation ATPase DnaA
MNDALLTALSQNHCPPPAYSPPSSQFWFQIVDDRPPPSLADIKATVAKYYGVTINGLHSNRRGKAGMARQVAMYLCCQLTDHTHTVIGRSFKKCDHTVSLHAYNRVRALATQSEEMTENLSRLEAMFA